jgi:hypothetical protein
VRTTAILQVLDDIESRRRKNAQIRPVRIVPVSETSIRLIWHASRRKQKVPNVKANFGININVLENGSVYISDIAIPTDRNRHRMHGSTKICPFWDKIDNNVNINEENFLKLEKACIATDNQTPNLLRKLDSESQ